MRERHKGMKYWAASFLLMLVGACTPIREAPDTAAGPVDQTIYTMGDHGLRIELTAPHEVSGGELFDISYRITDDNGELRGVEIHWDDGKTWGGMPMDLVCTGTSGTTEVTEDATDESEEISHAYRQPGTYKIRVSAYTGGFRRTGLAVPLRSR